jgi:hypothetical protein
MLERGKYYAERYTTLQGQTLHWLETNFTVKWDED